MKAFIRTPLCWILVLALALRLCGLVWGLPASDGWDNDGFAPRNFLTALALTWKPGAFFTYPPLHAIFLALPGLPVAAWAIAHAPSLSQAGVIGTITQPFYMTFFAVVGRSVSIAMSLGVIVILARMTALLAGRRAGLFAALAATLSATFTYYSQVSNLDVPCLFWALLALDQAMRAIAGHDVSRWRGTALCAAAAIATKDQAYGIFLLAAPGILFFWFAADQWPRRNVGPLARALLVWGAVSAVLLLLVDGAITNSSGFLHRLAFLTGPASGDFATYPNTLAGRWDLLRDIWNSATAGYGVIASVMALLGLWFHGARWQNDRARWVAGFLPLFAILSFTFCFNLVALRTDARFLLPQFLLATVYIGITAERLIALPRAWARCVATGILIATAAFALYWCIGVNAAFLNDPRYEAEAWMAAQIHPGDTIETYGQNAFLPRFPSGVTVWRVGETSLATRNPLHGVREVRAAFDRPRDSRYIVVSAWWAAHYTAPASELGGHRMPSPNQQALYADLPARRYFTALMSGAAGYHLAHVAQANTAPWPQVHIHASVNETVWIFERTP